MVLFNHATRELTAKIVYYGPGLCGKTTNLKILHERLEKGTAGRLLSLSTAQDRTIYFDLLPVELGNIKGYTVRFQLCTVPGQVFYNETRKLVLRGVDGLVFVVDSQWSMLSHNLESFQNLKENVKEAGASLESLPVVIQYNKRDLNGVLPVETLQESLAFQNYPFVEAVASEGKGVVETFKLVSKLTFVDLLRRLQKTGGIDDLAAPSPDTPDPGEETMVRSHRAEKRTSFVDAAIRTAAPFAAAEGLAASASDSPFDTEGWVAPPPGEVFGGTSDANAGTGDDPFLVPPVRGPEPALAPAFAAADSDARAVAVADAAPPRIPIAAPVTAPAAVGSAAPASAAAASLELAELKAKIDDLVARTAAASETLTRLESSSVRVDALEAMRERVDGLVGVMRHEVSQRIDPAARSIADLKNAFEASVERQTEAVTELRHATSREIAAALEARDAATSSPAIDRLRDEMTEKIARILADERESLDARRKEDLAAQKADLERLEATVGEKVREVGALRNDLESATNGLRLEFTSLLAKTAEEATAGREGFAKELESMRKAMDGFAGGEREARSALEGKLSAFEGALERLRSESDAAHTRAHERLFAAEERAKKLSEAVRKAFEGL